MPSPNPSKPAESLTEKRGIEGLREARKRLGLPDQVGEPGSFVNDPKALGRALDKKGG